VAILNITLLGPTPNNAAAQWEWTPIGSAPFYQSLFRHGDQFGADASDDFLTAGDVFNAEGGTNVVAEGEFLVVGVRAFDGGPIGDYVWSPPRVVDPP
jgi:hypothetical protein